MGIFSVFDAKMWVLLELGKIKIFRGQDVLISDRIIVGDGG